MYEEKTIDHLDNRSVSIKTDVYLTYDGESYKIKTTRVSYVNSESDRKRLQEEQPQKVVNAVFAIWGDKATVPDIKNDNTVD